jgi:hypothetical protein
MLDKLGGTALFLDAEGVFTCLLHPPGGDSGTASFGTSSPDLHVQESFLVSYTPQRGAPGQPSLNNKDL